MQRELLNNWLEALRSGKYPQTVGVMRGLLHEDDDGTPLDEPKMGYCCLGVLCDVVDPKGWENEESGDHALESDTEAYLRPSALETVGLTDTVQRELATMNDDGAPFTEIADQIEESVKATD